MTLFKKIAKMDAHNARLASKAYQVQKKADVKALEEQVMRAYNQRQKSVVINRTATDITYVRALVKALGFSSDDLFYSYVHNHFVLTFKK